MSGFAGWPRAASTLVSQSHLLPKSGQHAYRAKQVDELRRLAESDIPVLAFPFKRRGAEDWAAEHRHDRGQLFALTRGLLIVEAGGERWMFPSQRCAWIPPGCLHAARSVGGATGCLLYLSKQTCRTLPRAPRLLGTSQMLFAIADRMLSWDPWQSLDPAQKRLIGILRDEIRKPEKQSLRLPIPRDPRLAGVARSLLDHLEDDRTLDDWARQAGFARRSFMRAFANEVGMTFGRWRQQARLFAALELLARGKSVTETAMAVGYDSVSAFILMFRTMLGTTPQAHLGRTRSKAEKSKG